MPVTLCVLIWAVAGSEGLLVTYEDEVLSLLGDHRGRLLQRVRRLEGGDEPYEVQVVQFIDETAYASFLDDPRRMAAAPLRDRCIGRTEVIRVDQV